jgi:hypothetical protein
MNLLTAIRSQIETVVLATLKTQLACDDPGDLNATLTARLTEVFVQHLTGPVQIAVDDALTAAVHSALSTALTTATVSEEPPAQVRPGVTKEPASNGHEPHTEPDVTPATADAIRRQHSEGKSVRSIARSLRLAARVVRQVLDINP